MKHEIVQIGLPLLVSLAPMECQLLHESPPSSLFHPVKAVRLNSANLKTYFQVDFCARVIVIRSTTVEHDYVEFDSLASETT